MTRSVLVCILVVTGIGIVSTKEFSQFHEDVWNAEHSLGLLAMSEGLNASSETEKMIAIKGVETTLKNLKVTDSRRLRLLERLGRNIQVVHKNDSLWATIRNKLGIHQWSTPTSTSRTVLIDNTEMQSDPHPEYPHPWSDEGCPASTGDFTILHGDSVKKTPGCKRTVLDTDLLVGPFCDAGTGCGWQEYIERSDAEKFPCSMKMPVKKGHRVVKCETVGGMFHLAGIFDDPHVSLRHIQYLWCPTVDSKESSLKEQGFNVKRAYPTSQVDFGCTPDFEMPRWFLSEHSGPAGKAGLTPTTGKRRDGSDRTRGWSAMPKKCCLTHDELKENAAAKRKHGGKSNRAESKGSEEEGDEEDRGKPTGSEAQGNDEDQDLDVREQQLDHINKGLDAVK